MACALTHANTETPKPLNTSTLQHNNTLTLSLIIPVHRGGEKFRQCMSSVLATNPQPDEIIIVADGGTADTPLPANRRNIKILETKCPGGPAYARNLGAKHAKGDILFFIDADVLISPDAIARVKKTLAAQPEISALIGSYDDSPGERNFLSQYRNLLHHYVHQTAKGGRRDILGSLWRYSPGKLSENRRF